jgi:thiosulfate reductase cytochrome b subunit
MQTTSVEPVREPRVKSAIRKATVVGVLALTLLVVMATPAVASTGGVLAEAKPWHYWIAYVLVASALGIVLIALPIGYYLRVYRLKHPRR